MCLFLSRVLKGTISLGESSVSENYSVFEVSETDTSQYGQIKQKLSAWLHVRSRKIYFLFLSFVGTNLLKAGLMQKDLLQLVLNKFAS